MALRTFRNNPSLGGFGSETSDVPSSSVGKQNKSATCRKRSRQNHCFGQSYRTLSETEERSKLNQPTADYQHVNVFPDEVDSFNNSENLTCDAFAQIIKELVDNAVDACSMDRSSNNPPNQPDIPEKGCSYKRVRVLIQEFESDYADLSESRESFAQCNNALLRVTVSDNGCGIENISESVNAFQSTKTFASDATAGRFGIGLTLCLLHAQRLVPSFASITSATKAASSWTKVSIKVDADNEKISFSNQKTIPKKADEARFSGTAVSILLPGGKAAKRAWPRLAEYLARYQLSLDLKCSIDVIAPSLSPLALSIKPQLETEKSSEHEGNCLHSQKPSIEDDLLYENDIFESIGFPDMNNLLLDSQDDDLSGIEDQIGEMKRVEKMKSAVSKYLDATSITLENITSHTHPIRRVNNVNLRSNSSLELFMIAYDKETESTSRSSHEYDNSKACAFLIRFFNHIPLLDSAEASACGLYHAMVGAKTVWNSFGVDLRPSNENVSQDRTQISSSQMNKNAFAERKAEAYRNLHMPTFELADTAHIAQNIRATATAHGLFQANKENYDNYDFAPKVAGQGGHTQKQDILLPIGARFRNLLIIAYLNANHQDMSFPSLSKGRLPMNDHGIKEAFDICLNQCLEKLQWKNPSLFPSPSILRKEQRDNRYIPLISSALASLSDHSSLKEIPQSVMCWTDSTDVTHELSQTVNILTEKIENRIRIILEFKEKESTELQSKPKRQGSGNNDKEVRVSDDESSISSNKSLSHFIRRVELPLTSAELSCQKENTLTHYYFEKYGVSNHLSPSQSISLEMPQSSPVLYVSSPHSTNTNGFLVFDEW